MNKIILVFVSMALSFLATAQPTTFFVEEQSIYTQGQTTPNGFMQANHYFKDSKYGVFTYAFVCSVWGELIAGVTKTYTLKNDGLVEVGVGGGIETASSAARGAGYIFTVINPRKDGKYKFTGFVNGEYGGSGYWYVGFLIIDITKHVSIGVHAQYGATCGPRLQVQSGHLMLWGAAGKNLEGKCLGAAGGIRLTF